MAGERMRGALQLDGLAGRRTDVREIARRGVIYGNVTADRVAYGSQIVNTIDPWSLLTPDEQSVISSKLNGQETCQTYRHLFNRIIGNKSVKEIKNMVTLVRNFIDSMGGHTDSAIWRQIKSFEGVWLGHDSDRSRNDPKFHEGGGVIFVVKDKATFLD